ncbi:MAG: flavin reductase family protein [Desulfomonilaceae bacterium]
MDQQVDYDVFRDVSYGLYLVSARAGDRINGQIVNTVIQVTSTPPCFAVIINRKNYTHELISIGKVFGVSVLKDSTPFPFIGLFGFRSGRDVNKFENVEYVEGVTGCPLVSANTLGVMEVKLMQHLEVGTHTVFIGEVISSRSITQGRPLTYEYYHLNLKGKTSQNAPTFNPRA